MTFEPPEIAFTSSTIYRLAQAVETHVENHELAARLRTLAVQIEHSLSLVILQDSRKQPPWHPD